MVTKTYKREMWKLVSGGVREESTKIWSKQDWGDGSEDKIRGLA